MLPELELTTDLVQKAFTTLLSQDLKELTSKLPKEKRISKKDSIGNLNKSYKNGSLVLVLGAGVSLRYGMPGWDQLLQELMVRTIEEEQSVSNVLSQLFNRIFSPNPVIAGRYLQKYFQDKKISFENAVREVLYDKCDYEIESSLMSEIITFCVAPGKSPNLDSIITYNFDDLVEQKLSNVGIDVPFKSVFGNGINPEDGELPIYHVHGFLPRKGKISKDNQITFGESIYHEQYNDIYSWANITQINKFRDKTCIFIGSSLTDPNTRRLLDIANIQRGDNQDFHYIFRKKYDEEKTKNQLKIILEENKLIFDEKIKAEMKFEETLRLLIKIIERFEEK